MHDQQTLLKTIQKYDFTLYELQLYLDTHPNCKAALQQYRQTLEKKQQAESAYVAQFGPLVPHQSNTTNQWNWTEGPWPWEQEAN